MMRHETLPLVLLTWAAGVFAQGSSCGSLITYRQYSVLLSEAPQCFREGCNQTDSALSMSSDCPAEAPCGRLWELIRLEWQDEWCNDCDNDVACRIPGWPILNGTSACDVSPQERLFGIQGGCCIDDHQPFELADWMGAICNGSEWREPFTVYGGMAKEDWQEWIEPWNWTVQPHNTSTKNYTLDVCDSPEKILSLFGIDNVISLGEALFELVVTWLCLHGSRTLRKWAVKEVISRRRVIFGGLVTGALFLMTNFGVALMWQYTPGYQDSPAGRVGLALCARPSALGYICFVGILFKPVSKEIFQWKDRVRGELETEATLQGQTPRTRTEGLKHWFKRKLAAAPNAEEEADLLTENWALMIAISELIVQLASCYSTFKTTDVGVKRDFYNLGTLKPFWRGSPALRMYAGAIFHCIAFVPSVASLIASAAFHARKIKFQEMRIESRTINALRTRLNDYYAKNPEALRQKQIAAHCQQALQQIFKERRTKPSFWRKLWPGKKENGVGAGRAALQEAEGEKSMMKRMKSLGRAGRVKVAKWVNEGTARVTLRRGGQGQQVQEQNQEDRGLVQEEPAEDAHSGRSGSPELPQTEATGAGSSRIPVPVIVTTAYDPLTQTTDPSTGDPPGTLIIPQQDPRQTYFSVSYTPGDPDITVRTAPRSEYVPTPDTPTRVPLAGRILSLRPFSSIVKRLHAWTIRVEEEHMREQQFVGPRYEEYVKLLENMQEEKYYRDEGFLRHLKILAYVLTFMCVTANYLSQWLFWSGYVESSGERWCPPDAEFKLEKGIWAAITFFALLISIITSVLASQPQ